MWRRVLKMHFNKRYRSMRGILTKALGGSGEENAHLPNLNIRQNSDSSSTSSMIKLLKNDLEKLRRESGFLKVGEKQKVSEIHGGQYLHFPNGAFYHPPRYHCREAFMVFDEMLERKIESEGEKFLNIYSKPYELFVKLDMEELKQKYPLVRECDYIYLIEKRIMLCQMCKDIERRHELMVFLAQDDYKGCRRNEMMNWIGSKWPKELFRIPVFYRSSSMIHRHHGTDPNRNLTFYRYLKLMKKDDKMVEQVKSEPERLTLVNNDRDKSLFDVKKWYWDIVLLDFTGRDASYESMTLEEQEWLECAVDPAEAIRIEQWIDDQCT